MQYNLTPVVEIHDKITERAGIRLLIKLEHLNHATVSGNKWWKLKHNVAQAKEKGFDMILTFGGAYSNHIYATAAAARLSGLQSIGIIRGEEVIPLNNTLQFARENGMRLKFISRTDYRRKTEPEFLDSLRQQFGRFYLVPEGGTNELAVRGVAEFAREHLSPLSFDRIFLPVGTGGTIAGIIAGLEHSRQITGVAVLKNGAFLKYDVASLLQSCCGHTCANWNILTEYHHGGYAKTSSALEEFILKMRMEHGISLDPVYTGKMMWALFEEIKSGNIARGETVLALHTGGLQGKTGS